MPPCEIEGARIRKRNNGASKPMDLTFTKTSLGKNDEIPSGHWLFADSRHGLNVTKYQKRLINYLLHFNNP